MQLQTAQLLVLTHFLVQCNSHSKGKDRSHSEGLYCNSHSDKYAL